MLRKLKQQVTQAVNGVSTGSEVRHELLLDEHGTEGFLCPVCMQSFLAADQLQAHFAIHTTQQANDRPASCSLSYTSSEENGFHESEAIHLELDIKELKSQLQDEKRYSTELKKELDRLHGLIANQSHIPQGEVPYLTQQVQMLEAGKALATERMLEMEKEASAVNRLIEQMKIEKVGLIRKIGDLSTSITLKTDELEEKTQEKSLLGDELVRYRHEIQSLEMKVEQLEKQLEQRPSEDDVSVLRKELVHAQQLMDTITQEKERKIKENMERMENMEQDREQLFCEIANLKSTIEELEGTIDKYKVGNKKIPDEIESFKNIWEEKIAVSNQNIANGYKKIDDLEHMVNECKNKIAKNTVDCVKVSEMEKTNGKLMEENAKCRQELQQKQTVLEETLSRAEKAENICDILRDKISSITINIEKQKEAMISEKEAALCEYKEEIEQLKKHISKLQTSLSEASIAENNMKQNLNEARAKERLLMQKISEGQGAEKLALEEMHKEKIILEEKMNDLSEKLKSSNYSHEIAMAEQEKNWIEKLDSEKKKRKELGNELDKYRNKCALVEEESQRKCEYYSETEEKHKKTIRDLNKILEARDSDIEALKSECANLTEMLEEKIRTIEMQEKIVETGRTDLKTAVEKLALMEDKTRKLDDDLHDTRETVTKRNEQCMELEEMVKKLEIKLNNAMKIKQQMELEQEEKEKSLNGTIDELQKLLSNNKEEKCNLEEKLHHVSQQISVAGEECERYKDSYLQLQRDLEQKMLIIKELEVKITDMTVGFNGIESSYEKQLSALSEELIKIKEECAITLQAKDKEMEDKYNNLLMTSQNDKDQLEQKIKDLKEKADEAEKKFAQKEQELDEKVKNLMTSLEQEKYKYDESLKNLQCKLNEVQQENATIMIAKEKEYEVKLKEMSLKLEAEKEIYEKGIYNLNEDLIKSKEANAKLLDDKEKEIMAQLKTISKLDEQLRSKTEQLSENEKQMVEMQDELQSVEAKMQNMKETFSEINERNLKLQKELDNREKCVYEMKINFEKQINSLNESLEDCKRDREESLLKVSAELKVAQSKLEETSNTLEEKETFLKELKKDLENARKDADGLKAVRNELEKRKAQWLQEKQVLQERCLTAESDLDFERERAAVNKRNFDDVQTAVQELGRVNQNLQMDFAKQTSRKWLDDSEAVNCQACDKPFTLTNRKHHCRQCGQIFCAPCSSFTAKIASSKNPVRVCNACYEEIAHR